MFGIVPEPQPPKCITHTRNGQAITARRGARWLVFRGRALPYSAPGGKGASATAERLFRIIQPTSFSDDRVVKKIDAHLSDVPIRAYMRSYERHIDQQ